MKATRVAILSLGYLCAMAVYAGQPEDGAQQTSQPEEPLADYDSIDYNGIDTNPTYFAWQDEVAPKKANIAGLHWQFDSGLLDGVHKIVGFWPSVHWLNANNFGTSMASLGYTWRNLKLEGALFRERDAEQPRHTEFLRRYSTAKRLSYKFGSNWDFYLSSRAHNSPDQLRPDLKVRRRTAALAYHNTINGNPWNTTLAVGRGRGLSGNSGTMYLFESAMRIGPKHTVFGRFERAGNDELFREEEASRQRSYQANKMTMGYLYDVAKVGSGRLGIGGLVSRRAVPDELLPYYGSRNTSYMVFLRLQMQFAAN